MHSWIEGSGVCCPNFCANNWSMDVPARISDPSVCFGCAAVRKVDEERVWSAPSSASVCDRALFRSVSLTIVTYSRNGSSGLSVGVNSKFAPSLTGDQ